MTVYYVLDVVMATLVIFLIYKIPYIVGWWGERFVSSKFAELPREKYKIFHNLLLPLNNEIKTTQIDHVIVSNYGIFIIETKSYGGSITGDNRDRKWTQFLHTSKKPIHNPEHQNYAHERAIEMLIRPLFPNVPIIGFIAFPSAKRIQIIGTSNVGHARDIIAKIKNYNDLVISDNDKEKIIDIIENANIKDWRIRHEHNKRVRELKNKNSRSEASAV
jgi:hypothetical protein